MFHQPTRLAAQAAMAGAFGMRPQHGLALRKSLWGLSFDNPLGLASGFDKDGTAARAWPLMVRRIDAARQSAADRYRELAGTGKTSSSIRRIVPTACQGQIESLFVDRGSHQWGTFDAATGDVQLRAVPGPDTDDLLDFAATQTALNRGQVFAVDSDEMPAHAVAAVFRY